DEPRATAGTPPGESVLIPAVTKARLPMTAKTLDPALRRAITLVAHTPRLLVACDYDGTLAPIVADPGDAVPQPESISALCALAGLHETTTAVISGRALRDLTALARLPPEVYLIGSHGS